MDTHNRLMGLWKHLVRGDTDQRSWMIHLDVSNHIELLNYRDNGGVDGSLQIGVANELRWRGIPFTVHHHGTLISYGRAPQLVSIEYKLHSGRVCYLDDPDNAPYWTKGLIKMEMA